MTSTTHAASAQRPPGARTLYLGHGERKRASISDHCLVITNVLAQSHRFPLPRLARIVCSTTVDWSGAALQTCQREAITITWVDPQGHTLGTLYPHHRRTSTMTAALDLLLEQPEGLQRYHHWRRARRMALLREWHDKTTPTPQAQEWEQQKIHWVYGDHISAHLPTEMQAQCMALVAHYLAADHIPPVCYGPESQPINIDHDLCNLLWGEMNLCCGAIAASAQDRATHTALWEAWKQRNAATLLLHIQSLNRLAHKALRPTPMQ